MRKPLPLFLALTSVILAAGLSCDSPTPSAPARPSAPRVTSLELVAPSTLAPGTIEQLRAMARLSDGTTQDVSGTAQWFSDSVRVVAINSGGLATALGLGEANVYASYAEHTSTRREIIVVPQGTFRMRGRVVEEDAPDIVVSGALVDPGIVPAATTGADGTYRLYGIPGQVTVRVSRNGYATNVQSLSIQDHHTQNFALALTAARANVAGTFDLTIEAADTCRGRIPDALLRRRYTATITQTGPRLQVELSGATFAANANKAAGSVENEQIFLDFYYDVYYYGDAEMAEVLDDGTYFVVGGRGTIAPVGNNFSGRLSATLWVLPTVPYRGAAVSCSSNLHRVTLNR